MLLCAAAEEGDLEEVVRLLSTVGVSPNARGLRHKNALHLAAAKGHQQVVEVLLINGVSHAKGECMMIIGASTVILIQYWE